ncbi:MAG: energy transducer TonB [Myxococcales bacterium]|nr:energy transducer TonB [Myxococcales bacterium]
MQNSASNHKRPRHSELLPFLLAAVVLHLALLPLLPVISGFFPESTYGNSTPNYQEVQLISANSIKSKKHVEKQRVKKEVPRQEPEPPLNGQVVDLPPTLNQQEAAEDARFLAESTHRTQRETRSRHQNSMAKNASHELARRQASKPNKNKMHQSPKQGAPDEKEKNRVNSEPYPQLALPNLRQRQRIQLKLDDSLGALRNQSYSDAINGQGQQAIINLGQKQGRGQAKEAQEQSLENIELIPQIGVLAQITGAPMNDHLDEVEEGDGTFLNTREFKYASFFNRLKRGVSQHWSPFPEYRRRDPTGHVYGKRNRMTVLKVTLNADGSLKKAIISKSSGLKFLDKEAIAAFERAQPFPNPPSGLLNQEGHIQFPFGFNIDFSRRQGMRLPF